jgi:hypothetical protein
LTKLKDCPLIGFPTYIIEILEFECKRGLDDNNVPVRSGFFYGYIDRVEKGDKGIEG